ncbi:MAG TPA: efflux RND transporter periplasmic adaptor subunit [Rhizomicrobium sp.]|jgi:multidrug efflux system membrane fusion protein|nr:efflux RND transporter periplasmic adaptor subunit [Rhizomicrobium sp.]
MRTPYAENLPADGSTLARSQADDGPYEAKSRFPAGLKKVLWVLLGLVLLVLLVWAIRPAGQTAPGRRGHHLNANGPIPVGVARAALSDVRVRLNALGAVTPLATVTVKPQVSGTIQKISFTEGQMVHAGDVLAEIDPRPYQAVMDQAKGALARDKAQLTNAQVDLKRYQQLWSQNAISQQILATAEASVRTDEGTVEADKGALEAAAVNLAFCKVTTPVAGRVGIRQVDIGNYVQVGVTSEIVVVTELQPMSVLFTLPEDDIDQILSRTHAGAKLPVDAYDRANTLKISSGALATVDNQVDPTTGTLKLRALFDNSDLQLFPSQFVNIRLLVDTLHRQVTVPVAAVQHGAAGDYVYAVGPDKRVHMQSVQLGPTDGDIVSVKHGLVAGTTVVVDGADQLSDGAPVTIPGKTPFSGPLRNGTGSKHGHRHRRSSDGS